MLEDFDKILTYSKVFVEFFFFYFILMLCHVNFLVLLYTRDIPYLLSALKSEPSFFGCEIQWVIRCYLFYYFFCIYLFSFDGSKFRRVQPPGPNSKTSKPVIVDILANGAPSSPGTYDRARDSIHPKIRPGC